MAAATAVFNTYELLEKIVVQLSPIEILRLMRVSKTWCSLIKSSAVIQKTTCILEPRQKLRPDLFEDNYPEIPVYDVDCGIRFHHHLTEWRPKILHTHTPRALLYDVNGLTANIETFMDLVGEQVQHDFITRPPCQALGLVFPDVSSMVMYVKGGIRFHDLQQVISAITKENEEIPCLYIYFKKEMRAPDSQHFQS